ncbi:hypothetical protein V1634_21755 [Plantactinospora veratri]|uniref:Secreted protein n=1 Tax=Plantactinospora veratri TaxID=1436122 RepID=A0ABU7SHS2_9ACTN
MPWLAALFFRAFFFRDFFAMLTSVCLPWAAPTSVVDRPFLLAPGNPPMVAGRPRRGGTPGSPAAEHPAASATSAAVPAPVLVA